MPAAAQQYSPETDDAARLEALDQLDVLDTPREEAFDRITRLIKSIFGVEIAIVSMIDGHRQWYKSVEGLATTEEDLETTFCKYTVLGAEPVVVADATLDARFRDNPHVTGAPSIRFYAGIPLRTREGHNVGTVCAIGYEPRKFSARETQILEDLTQIAMNELELRQQASADSLTGALSRRAFKEEASRAVSLGKRHGHPVSCIAIDLDRFKSINDRFGHPAGDRVLVGAIEACRRHLRKTDLIGRLGGEEFAVMLPHTAADAALAVAEKLRASIAAQIFEFGGKRVLATASFGVATLEADDSLDDLLSHADIALYEAKANGRNACVIWQAADVPVVPDLARRRVLKAGRLIFNQRHSTINCTIRSLSDAGAGIDVTSAVGIPDVCSLAINGEIRERQCRVIMRAAQHIEVQFTDVGSAASSRQKRTGAV